MPAPERFTIQRGGGPQHTALHPDKRDALHGLLVEKPKQKKARSGKQSGKPQAGEAQGVQDMVYRMHDPSYRYFQGVVGGQQV